MKIRTLAAPLLLALVAGALVAPAGSSASGACTSGSTKIGGKPARTFCGSAKATAKLGSKTFTFSGGECVAQTNIFTLNIGTLLVSAVANAKPGPKPYFGVVVTPSGSGTHLNQVVTWISSGKRYSVIANQVTLKGGQKSGSFKGNAIPGGGKVTGTFAC